MSHDFFRKERRDVFLSRISAPTAERNFYRLRSGTVFQAKNANGAKRFTVTVAGKTLKLKATVSGTTLVITDDTKPNGTPPLLSLTEADMPALQALGLEQKKASLACQVMNRLCADHALASTHSPLISGCVVNNFEASKTYAGERLHLQLKTREPFLNPLASGNEKEAFLIGRIESKECTLIKYLGSTHATGVNEIVREMGSGIPNPK